MDETRAGEVIKTRSLQLLLTLSFLFPRPSFPQAPIAESNTSAIDSSRALSDSSGLRTLATEPVLTVPNNEMHTILAEDALDYFRLMPSVTALDLGPVGQRSVVAIRGGNGTGSQVVIDDIAFADPLTGVFPAGYFPLNLFEHIAFDGFGAHHLPNTGSVLRVRTLPAPTSRPYSKVVFRAGDFGYSDIGLIFSMPLNPRTRLMLDGSRQEFGGSARDHTGSRVLVKVNRDFDKQTSLRSVSFLNKSNVTLPAPLIPNVARNPAGSNWQESRFDQVFTVRTGDLSAQKHQLRGQLHFWRISQTAAIDTVSVENRTLSLEALAEFSRRWGRHRLAVGGQVTLHDLNSQGLGDHQDRLFSLYFRDVLHLTDPFGLHFGLELEKHDAFPFAVKPALTLRYRASTTTTWWLGVQHSRRYPTFSERYWPEFYRGNPNLLEERGTAAEIGFDLNRTQGLRMQTAVFLSRIHDWIGNVVLGDTSGIVPGNFDQRTVVGAELKFTWETFPGGRLGLSGTFLTAAGNDVEKQLQVPEYSIYAYLESGRAFFQDFVFVRARLAGRVFGERHGIDYLRPLAEYVKLDPNAIFDGQITLEFASARALFAIENLLGTRYQMVPGFFMPERMFRFGIEWEFWD